MKEKHIEILEPIIMSTIMCFFMSLIMTWVHLGFSEGFLMSVIKAFLHGIIVALPVGVFIGPVVKHLVQKIPVDKD